MAGEHGPALPIACCLEGLGQAEQAARLLRGSRQVREQARPPFGELELTRNVIAGGAPGTDVAGLGLPVEGMVQWPIAAAKREDIDPEG